MVEMSVEDNIKLMEHEFMQLVLDELEWQDELKTARILYAKTIENIRAWSQITEK